MKINWVCVVPVALLVLLVAILTPVIFDFLIPPTLNENLADVPDHPCNQSSSTNQQAAVTTSCGACTGTWPTKVKVLDYGVAGLGPGGAMTTYDIKTALSMTPANAINSLTVGAIEARDRVGGNFWDEDLVKPAGYNLSKAPLKIGLGGLRVNIISLLNERRSFSELNVPMYGTPFRQWMFSRGRQKLCAAPSPDQVYTEFCSNNPIFINSTQTELEPIGAAYVGLNATYNGVSSGEDRPNDPSFAAWCFLTHAPDRQITDDVPAACDYGDYSVPVHPLTGLECDDSHSDSKRWCPRKACTIYVDFKSMIADYLSPEYAAFLEDDNVGFKGDFRNPNNACSYLDWVIREWNTASLNLMPVGGMSQLPIRAVNRAVAKGAQVFLSEPALCVRRRQLPGTHLYEIRTPSYTIKVNKWLFLAIPAVDITRPVGHPNFIGGDIMDEIRAKKEINFPSPTRVSTLSMQWQPGAPAWFYPYMDQINGNWSLRLYGDLDCFARIEIWDTPWHRFHNGIRVNYNDAHCQSMWEELIEIGEKRYADGMPLLLAYNDSIARVMQGFQKAFPGATIPPPVWTRGATWEHAWQFGKAASPLANQDVTEWAKAPLGRLENLCLIGDAYNGRYSGHAESALISSRNCLTQPRFASGVLKTRLAQLYSTRDAILPNTWDAITAVPSGLPNEYWGPYGPYNPDGTLQSSFCVGNNGGPSGSFTCKEFL